MLLFCQPRTIHRWTLPLRNPHLLLPKQAPLSDFSLQLLKRIKIAMRVKLEIWELTWMWVRISVRIYMHRTAMEWMGWTRVTDTTQVWFIFFPLTHSHFLPEPENFIDEQSPDEDERLALQVLRGSNDNPFDDGDAHEDNPGMELYSIRFYIFSFSVRVSASRFVLSRQFYDPLISSRYRRTGWWCSTLKTAKDYPPQIDQLR